MKNAGVVTATDLSSELNNSLFENLVWMTSGEAARYLRKTVGALRVMVCRGQLHARKFQRRLYFKKSELDRLLETSHLKGGF